MTYSGLAVGFRSGANLLRVMPLKHRHARPATACAFLVANSLNNCLPTLYTTVYHLALPQALRAASMTNVAQVALVWLCAMVGLLAATRMIETRNLRLEEIAR